MTYSDKDILDLHTDLQDIGLAETPTEEAQRHCTNFRAFMKGNPFPRGREGRSFPGIGVNSYYLREYLTQQGVPHTYVSRLTAPEWRNFSFEVFPVVRGQAIMALTVVDIDSLPEDFRRHEDLPSLLAYTEELKVKWSDFEGAGLETLNIV
jgi:hypothetical protein